MDEIKIVDLTLFFTIGFMRRKWMK